MAETGLWAWSRADSARLAKVLVVLGALLMIGTFADAVGYSCTIPSPPGCPNPWALVPAFLLLGVVLMIVGYYLRAIVKQQGAEREGKGKFVT